jgi:hypothetical protein
MIVSSVIDTIFKFPTRGRENFSFPAPKCGKHMSEYSLMLLLFFIYTSKAQSDRKEKILLYM